MPSQTRLATRSTTASLHGAVVLVAPPEEHVRLGKPRLGQAVLGLLQGGGARRWIAGSLLSASAIVLCMPFG
jgi:hypothetical protein